MENGLWVEISAFQYRYSYKRMLLDLEGCIRVDLFVLSAAMHDVMVNPRSVCGQGSKPTHLFE